MLQNYFTHLFEESKLSNKSDLEEKLASIKEAAFLRFKNSGLPTSKDENYKTIDISKCFDEKYDLLLSKIHELSLSEKERLNLREFDFENYTRINGGLNNSELNNESENKNNCFIGPLELFESQNPEAFKKYYAKISERHTEDGLADFNTMLASEAYVIYLREGQTLRKPILLNDLLAGNKNGIIIKRLLIIIEKKSSMQLIINNQDFGSAKFLISQISEIYIDEEASLTIGILDDNSPKVTTLSSYFFTLHKKSKVKIYDLTLHGEKTRNNFYINFQGEEAEAKIYGVQIGSQKNKYIDNFVNVNHLLPNCTSTQLFRYILQGDSIGSFCGKVYVAKDAQKTLAYQSNNNLCVSDNSKMYSKPQLEIYADDVKCSHGLTTGQIDESAVFYLQSRGIPEKTARYMLIEAFANNTFVEMKYSTIKNWLFEKIKNTLDSGQKI